MTVPPLPEPPGHRIPVRPGKTLVAAYGGLMLLGMLGCWLIAAPFATGTQPRGGAWTAATRTDVTAGGMIVTLALGGLLGALAATLTWRGGTVVDARPWQRRAQ